MRLEVFNPNGDLLYNSEFLAGNMRDWALEDKQGQHLLDGSYLCVITIRDMSGRMDMKQGNVLSQGGQASLKLAESGKIGVLKWIFGMPAGTNGFQVYGLAANLTRFYVDPTSGNIGIDNTAPASKLDRLNLESSL